MALTKVQAAGLTADLIDETKLADNSIDSEHYNDGSIDEAHLADDAVTADKLANSINSEIAANTAKVTNATHTGEVTGATALTIEDDVVDEANLKVDNSPTNDYVLTAKSSAAGGLTWAAAATGVGGATGVQFNDDVKIRVGTGNDFDIYHNGTNCYLENNTGKLYLRCNTDDDDGGDIHIEPKTGEASIICYDDAGVELYNDNVKQLAVVAGGVEVHDDGDDTTIKMYSNSGSIRGMFYANNANEVGILDSGGHWAIEHKENDSTRFYDTDGTKRLTVDSDGVKFGTDTAAANALDDYEEGSHTPVITRSTSNQTATVNAAAARYTKVGRLVNLWFNIDLSGMGTSGEGYWKMSLPFTTASDVQGWSITSSNSRLKFDGSERAGGDGMLVWAGTGNADYVQLINTDVNGWHGNDGADLACTGFVAFYTA